MLRHKMSTRIPVPLLTQEKEYSRFRQELTVWRKVTNLEKSQQAAVVALSLPEGEKYKINIRGKVFEEIDTDLYVKNNQANYA